MRTICSTSWRRMVPVSVLGLAVALAGCGDRRAAGAGETGATAGADTTTIPSADSGARAGMAGALTDANIMALLDEANQADSASGALAVSKGTSAEVKAFGKLMMADHHKLRVGGASLAKAENISPAPPADDPVAAMARDEKTTLQSAAKGAQFDQAYITQTIAGHQAVLDLLDRSSSATTNARIKALIEKARPEVQGHLTKAQTIQKRLSASA